MQNGGMSHTTTAAIITEPDTCPACGSDDLGVFAATAEREDCADIVECEACGFAAALTAEGLAELSAK